MNPRPLLVLAAPGVMAPGVRAAASSAESRPARVNLEQVLAFTLDHNSAIRQARERLRAEAAVVDAKPAR